MLTNRMQQVVILIVVAQLGSWAVLLPSTRAESNQPNYDSVWTGFLRWFQRKKPPYAGRGGDCIVSPILDKEPVKIWNDRPMLIWNGNTTYAGIFSLSHDQITWKEKVHSNATENRKLQYRGEALQPGQVYKWQLLAEISPSNLKPVQSRPFQILESSQRNQVTADLNTLQVKLKSERASMEAIALHRAEFFTQRGLQTDALQELFSVQNPSPNLNALTQKITDKLCNSAQAESSRKIPQGRVSPFTDPLLTRLR